MLIVLQMIRSYLDVKATLFGDWSKSNWPKPVFSISFSEQLYDGRWVQKVAVSLTQVEKIDKRREFHSNKVKMTELEAESRGDWWHRTEMKEIFNTRGSRLRWHQRHQAFARFNPLIQSLIGIKWCAPRVRPFWLFIEKAIFHFTTGASLFWQLLKCQQKKKKNSLELVYLWTIGWADLPRKSDENKPAQSRPQPQPGVKRWLWCMTWHFPHPSNLLFQIDCTFARFNYPVNMAGLASSRKIFDNMRTLRDPFILIWEKQSHFAANVCCVAGWCITLRRGVGASWVLCMQQCQMSVINNRYF